MDDFRPWRRDALAPEIPDDSDAAWRAFEGYLVQYPTRNLGRLATELRVPLDTVQYWRKVYAWDARVRAYDEHLTDIRDTIVEDTVEAATRAACSALKLAGIEFDRLREAQTRIDAPGIITPREAIRALEASVKQLQLLGGRPTERVEVAGPDLSKLSDDELEQWRALTAKASD